MTDILELMDKAERLQAELIATQSRIMEIVQQQAIESAAVALSSAARALKKAEHYPKGDEQRHELRSSRRLVEAQLGWGAA